MPLIRIATTVALTSEKQQALLPALSRLVAETLGKPEQYVMVAVGTEAMLMSGQPGPAAFVDLRSIGGLNPKINRQLAEKISHLLEQMLLVPAERVFLNFTDVPPSQWGWRGETFG